jgi:hypothetical protein
MISCGFEAADQVAEQGNVVHGRMPMHVRVNLDRDRIIDRHKPAFVPHFLSILQKPSEQYRCGTHARIEQLATHQFHHDAYPSRIVVRYVLRQSRQCTIVEIFRMFSEPFHYRDLRRVRVPCTFEHAVDLCRRYPLFAFLAELQLVRYSEQKIGIASIVDEHSGLHFHPTLTKAKL